MLITFALLAAWIPCIIGWGSIAVFVRKWFRVVAPDRYDALDPFIGLGLLMLVAIAVNFFAAISYPVAVGIFLIGWFLFLARLPRLKGVLEHPIWIGIGLVWIGIISTQAVLQAWNYDSGLYHIPAIRWFVDSAVPFGLANLHGRLGFDSTWFSVSALIAQSVAPYTSNYTALASELLFVFFGFAVIGAVKTLFQSHTVTLSTIFLVLCGFAGFARFVTQNLSSPSTDHPVFLLSLLVTYAALRTLEQSSSAEIKYDVWVILTLGLFTVTIKISMLPLVLLGIALIVVFRLGGRQLLERDFIVASTSVILLIFGSWFARNLVLSGCLVYPLSPTCIWSLPWAVTRQQAESEAMWIASWARNPRNPPEIVLRDWSWLKPWAESVTNNIDFLLAFAFAGVGLALFALFRKRRPPNDVVGILTLVIASLLGMIYWFFTAPDIRFGASWFWMIGLILLAVGLESMQALSYSIFIHRGAAIVLLVASGWLVAQVGISYVQRAQWGISGLLYAVPPMPVARDIQVKKTKQGIPINVVEESRCYWTSPLCTPYFNERLDFSRLADGRLVIKAPH
jgi:hypothetical protein